MSLIGVNINDIHKNDGESLKDYKIRLCRNKDLYNITFVDIAKLINEITGENKGESSYRKWWRGYSEGYTDAIEKYNSEAYNLQRIEFEKERQKFFDYRSAYKKMIRDESRKEINFSLILQAIQNLKPYEPSEFPSTLIGENDMLICLDDIHYGSSIDNYWNKYNSDIAKERLVWYLAHIRKVRNIHNVQRCYLCCNGDLISGNIHLPIQITNKENIVEQIIGVSELLSWFISELCKEFREVFLSVVSGNHSRISTKDNSLKNERLDDLIPWYIKSRLQNLTNFKCIDNDIDNTISLVNIRGLNYLNVHGDYDSFSSVSKVIEMTNKDIYCVHFAHLHHNSYDTVNKYKVIRSGSLQGMDDYCIQKRIYGKAEQLICVCNGKGILCTYDVDLQNPAMY